MDLRIKHLLKDIFIFTAGNALSKVILFFLMPLYTAKLTTSEYGVSDTLNTLIQLFVPIVTLCIADAVFRFSVELNEKETGMAFVSGLQILLTGCAAFALLGIAAQVFFGFRYTFILICMLLTQALSQFFGSYLRGNGKSTAFAVSGVVSTIFLTLSNLLLLVVFQTGIYGYLWSIVISNTVSILIMLIVIHPLRLITSDIWTEKQKKKRITKNMLQFSLPVIPNNIFWWLSSTSNKYILLYLCGASATGLFSAAGKIPSIVSMLSNIFQQAWRFSAAKEYETEDAEDFYTKTFSLYSPFILFTCSFLLVINPLLSKFIFRGDFIKAQKYVPLLLYAVTVHCFSIFFSGIYTAAKKNKMLMISTLIGALVNIAACFLLIPFLKVYGALAANILGYFTILMIKFFDSKKYVRIRYKWLVLWISMLLLFWQALMDSFDTPINTFPLSVTIFVVLIAINAYHYIRTVSRKN